MIILCIGMVYGVNKTGTTAAKFLSIEVGSNAVGMGGAYTSIANDATAMYWNPAGLSFHDTKEVYFNHANWIADISFDYFGVTIPINDKSVLKIGHQTETFGTFEKNNLGEFLGILKLSKSGIKIFRTEYSKLINNYKGNFHEAKSIQTGYITDMLQELINLQYLVNPVIINGKWCEIDTLQDLERAKTMFL